MAKLKVIEVTGVKLDPHADYLVAVDVTALIGGTEQEKAQSLVALDTELKRRIGDKAVVLPVLGKVSDHIKVFQIPKEITVRTEIKLNGK